MTAKIPLSLHLGDAWLNLGRERDCRLPFAQERSHGSHLWKIWLLSSTNHQTSPPSRQLTPPPPPPHEAKNSVTWLRADTIAEAASLQAPPLIQPFTRGTLVWMGELIWTNSTAVWTWAETPSGETLQRPAGVSCATIPVHISGTHTQTCTFKDLLRHVLHRDN